MSREHVTITLENDGATVTDLQTTYGTVLYTPQGHRSVCPSHQPVRLVPPCQLELGSLLLMITSPNQP